MAELDDGNVDLLVQRLMAHASHCEEAADCADSFRKNQHRMRYAELRAAGLCTSTGVVEAGCKNVIGTRLKRPGMHWTARGANAIISLRSAKLSNRLDPFLDRRSTQKLAA